MESQMQVPPEIIESKIFVIRGEKVIIDHDLAKLYGVTTKALKQSVKRNICRFPIDFMFELSVEEFQNLRSQFVTSKRGGLRFLPYAFTEQGVAMLSGILNSERAINVNIAIMRAFVQMRRLMETHKDLAKKLEEMESKYDDQFRIVFEAIRQLIQQENEPRNPVGFRIGSIPPVE
jgi:hypothetical protein